jgi:hypothetical protein
VCVRCVECTLYPQQTLLLTLPPLPPSSPLQEDLDQLLLCLGQETRKAGDLAEAMRDAGLDPDAVTLPIEEEYAMMDLGDEEGGGGEGEGGEEEGEGGEVGEEGGWAGFNGLPPPEEGGEGAYDNDGEDIL